MCSTITCPTCKKITWSGCGRHVEETMAPVPPENRCACR
jgi:hypothetical protein